MKAPQEFHLGRIYHDGSGTIITAIDFVECAKPARCKTCEDGITTVTVTILPPRSFAYSVAVRSDGKVPL